MIKIKYYVFICDGAFDGMVIWLKEEMFSIRKWDFFFFCLDRETLKFIFMLLNFW